MSSLNANKHQDGRGSLSVKPVSEKLWQDIVALADKDGHDIWAPTHAIVKDGRTIGGTSINGIPNIWCFYSSLMNGRDVLGANQMLRDLIKQNGWEDFLMALGPESPLAKHSKRFGLTHLGQASIYYGRV